MGKLDFVARASAGIALVGDRFLRLAALTIWIAFVAFWIGNAISFGLCCADDGVLALAARSLANGTGYSVAIFDNALPPEFHPGITTGPTLIIPCAILLKVFGVSEIIPGLSAIIVWAGALTFLLTRVNRHVTGASLFLGVGVFCFSVMVTSARSMANWHAFIGEIAAVALVLLGHWVIAMERLSWRWLFLSGFCLGLAVQTKTLAVLMTVGGLVILVFRLKSSGPDKARWLVYSGIWLAGCILPTAIFECYKLIQLDFHAYLANWAAFVSEITKIQHSRVARPPVFELVRQRFALFEQTFCVNLSAFVILMALALRVSLRRFTDKWLWLFAGLHISIASLGLYWVFFSVGWPRYLLMAVVLGCFVLSIPIFASAAFWHSGLLTTLSVVLLAGGISRLSLIRFHADHGLFVPGSDRIARAKILETIRGLKQKAPIILAATWWAEFVDVQFSLDADMKFQRVDAIGPGHPDKKIILMNKYFKIPDERAYIEKTLGAPVSTVISTGPYELLEQPGSP